MKEKGCDSNEWKEVLLPQPRKAGRGAIVRGVGAVVRGVAATLQARSKECAKRCANSRVFHRNTLKAVPVFRTVLTRSSE